MITRFEATGNDKGLDFEVFQVVDYDYYLANGLPLTTVRSQVDAHICATTEDTSGCTNNPAPPPPPPPPPPPVTCDVVEPGGVVVSDPTPSVGVAGDLVGPALQVDVSFVDLSACGTITLFATDGATEVPGDPTGTSGNVVSFEFPVGSPLGVAGTTRNLDIRDDGSTRNNVTTVTTEAAAAPVPCTATLAVDWPNNYNANQDQVNQPLAASFTSAGSCGALALVLVPPVGTALQFSTPPALAGTVAKDHAIWSSGSFRVEVRNNGTPIADATKSF